MASIRSSQIRFNNDISDFIYRDNSMTEDEKNELVNVFTESLHSAMDDRKKIDDELHAKHHRYLDMVIEKDEKRKELIQNTKKQVVAWGLITMLTGIGYAVYDSLVNVLTKHQ